MGIDGTTLGSTLAVVDWKRSLLETRDYGPFGRVIEHTGDLGLKHQFTGQPSDGTTGLQNYGARMYDARWARFLTPDERIQSFDSQGLNRYSYVSNQPTSMIDPGGEFALGFGGGFGGIGGMSGMSSFGSIGSTGQLPQAASSQGIMSSGPGWPCGDDVCPGDPPLNLLGTEFAELYKAIAQEVEGSQNDAANDTSPVWPTDHHEITSPYNESRVDPVLGETSRPHRAIDIKNPLGDPVYSIQDGKVAEVGSDRNAGNFIKVDHAGGLQSSYAHTGSRGVSVGDSVTRGQPIGRSDGSGRGTGPHLHFTLRQNGVRINPCGVLSCP